MKKIQLLIYGLLLSLLTVRAADNTTRWHTYLAMYNTIAVAEAENNVYAVADGTLQLWQVGRQHPCLLPTDGPERFCRTTDPLQRLLTNARHR